MRSVLVNVQKSREVDMADKDKDKEVTEAKNKDVAVVDATMFEADAGIGMQMDQDDLA